MRRREFITFLGSTVAAWPLSARTQQHNRVRRIGVLSGGTEVDAGLRAFEEKLAQLGWMDGKNIRIDYRFGRADIGRMEIFAKELVGFNPDLIVGISAQAVAALQRATKMIPIVFTVVSDPVGSGFVSSLSHPGGNITGFTNLEESLGGKWITTLRDIVPRVAHAALLYNPQTAPYFTKYLQQFETAARSAAIEPVDGSVHVTTDIEPLFARIAAIRDAGLVVMPDIFTAAVQRNYDLIILLATRHRVDDLSISVHGGVGWANFLWS